MSGQKTEPLDHTPAWMRPDRVMLSQAPVVVLLTVVALPLFRLHVCLIGSATILLMALSEGLVCARAERHPTRVSESLAVASTFATSLAYAGTGLVIMGKKAPGANMFVIVLVASSMIYALLRYYQRPWKFLVSISPQVALLAMIGVMLAVPHVGNGRYLEALTPVATSVLLVMMFWAARQQLADAWRSLIERERAAAAANAAKSEFLATMSHEIRTPLNGVLGMAQAMTADELAAAQRERLKVIRRSGEDLLAILNDVLDLSKIESGALTLETTEFDLEHLARGAVATFAYETHKKGVGFHFGIEEAAKGFYRGDAARVRQIIYNLASNAVKFTSKGDIAVSLGVAAGGLCIRVTDTGVGIPPEKLSTLFDKFVQADGSATRRFGGAGLGLAITRELAALMGGQVRVKSTLGEGSAFTVTLPDVVRLEPANANAPAVVEGPRQTAEAAGDAPDIRVLAAEDNKVNQLVLKTLLGQAGIEPVIVENGQEVVEAYRSGSWDIVLMDIQMPVMDGVEAARAIRAIEARTGQARTPILAVTANAMVHQLEEYTAAGMDGVVPKPIEIGVLFAAIEAALDARTTSASQAA